MNPQDIQLHDVNSSKGHWGIFVQSIVEEQKGENVFVTLILEQNIDDEHIRSRKLDILVSASQLASPQGRSKLLNQIRNWIETTEGDGTVDGLS